MASEPCVPQAWPHPRLHSVPLRLPGWPGQDPTGLLRSRAPHPGLRDVASVLKHLVVGSRGLAAKPSQEKTSDARVPSDVHGDPLCMQRSHRTRKWGCRASQAGPGPQNFRSHTGPLVRTPRMRLQGHPGAKVPAGEQSGQPWACPVQLMGHSSRVRVCLAHVCGGTPPAECSTVGVSAQELVRA